MISQYQKPGIFKVLANMKLFVFLFFLLYLAGIRLFYIVDVENKSTDFNHREQAFLSLQKQYIGYELQSVVNDLGVMIGHQNAIKHGHTDDEFTEEFNKEFSLLCSNRRNYLRARIIGQSGTVKVSVECDENTPHILAIEDMADIDESMLTTTLKNLQPGSIYISDILHQNNTTAFKPYVRIVATLQHEVQTPSQLIVVDYLTQDLTSSKNESLKVFNTTAQGGTLYLTNNSNLVYPFIDGAHQTPVAISEYVTIRNYSWFNTQNDFIDTKKYYINRLFLSPQDLLSEMLIRRPSAEFTDIQFEPYLQWSLISVIEKDTLPFGVNRFLIKSFIILLLCSAIILPIGFAFRRNHIQQKLYQLRLDDQRSFLITMMDTMSSAVVATDKKGIIQTINPAVTKIFGYTSIELLNRNVAPLLPSSQISKMQNTSDWLQIHSQNNKHKMEYDSLHKDGTWVPIELSVSQSIDPKNPFYLLVMRDMSDRKEVEEEMKNLHQKYIHREKLAEVGLLVGGILHEVSNPLASVNGLLSNLLYNDSEKIDSKFDDETKTAFNVVIEHIERVRGLSYEVSSFLRPTSNEMALTDLNSVIHTTTNLIRFDHRWRDINLELKLDSQLPPIRAISDQLVQVVMNLLVNAADACSKLEDKEPIIMLGTEFKNHMAQVYIQDNGIGMDNETIRKIFQPFFTTKGNSGGTGLGMPLCEGIINDHGGHMEINSSLGEGTRITCFLPTNNY